MKTLIRIPVEDDQEGIADGITAKQALQESEEKFRKAFTTGMDAFFISTIEAGIFVECNEEFENLFGYKRDEIFGKSVLQMNLYIDPADRSRVISLLKEKGHVKNLELKVRKKEGTGIEISLSASIVHIKGKPHILGIARDITEHKRLEAQFYQAQKMEAVGRLVGGVAHDFNNLLTIILGCCNFILEEIPHENPIYADVEQIHKAGTRASELTTSLLAFKRKQLLQPRVLDLNTVVQENSKLLSRLIGEDIELITAEAANLGRIKADLAQIEQVIANLVVNAREAMPHGGKLTIATKNVDLDQDFAERNAGSSAGSFVMLSVSDTGTGMDAEIKSHLFEPLFTTKKDGKGTGIGLSAVLGIVKQNGGYIAVDSIPGCGSTFRVYLPRLDEAVQPAKAAQPVSARGTGTILLVEDVEEIRMLARRTLASEGYEVLEAKDGPDALKAATGYVNEIHLLATDMVLPGGINGLDLAKSLQASRSAIKVLYLSGYPDGPAGRMIPGPGDNFLAKPYSREDLVHKVREIIERH